MNGLFGYWTPAPGVDGRESTRGASSGLVWRADLPADPDRAGARLAQAENSLAVFREVLTTAEGRMPALSAALPGQPGGEGRTTRGILPEPERAVLALLAGVKTDQAAPPGEDWRTAVGDFQAFIALVQASISEDSRVETWVEGQQYAQTRLSARGDIQTIWHEQAGQPGRDLHLRSLQAALAGLKLMLHTLAVEARLASQLAGLIGHPDGNLLALPLAWRFILRLQKEHQA